MLSGSPGRRRIPCSLASISSVIAKEKYKMKLEPRMKQKVQKEHKTMRKVRALMCCRLHYLQRCIPALVPSLPQFVVTRLNVLHGVEATSGENA